MKQLAVVILAMVAATIGFAQQGPRGEQRNREQMANKTPEQMAQHRTDKMAQHLQLDETTKGKVYEILLQDAKDREALKAEMEPMRQQMKNSREAHKLKVQNQLKDVLSEEQYVKLKELEQQRMQQRKKRMQEHPVVPEE